MIAIPPRGAPRLRPAFSAEMLARRFAGRVAVRDAAGEITYAELFARAAGLARRLIEAGVRPGEPVASHVRNGRAAVWTAYAIAMAGAAEMPLNVAYTEAEIRTCLAVVPARVSVSEAARAGLFADLGCTALVAEDAPAEAPDASRFSEVAADAPGRIMFTSGTTGTPKAIVHTQRGRFVANALLQATLPFVPGPESRVLLMTPFAHGASLQTFAWLDQGAGVILLDGVRMETVAQVLEAGAADTLFAAPTVLAKFADGFAGRRFAGVRAIFTGTAPLTAPVYAAAREMFGPVVRVTYGKSEVFNPITVLPPADTDAFFAAGGSADGGACVGWPAPGVELALDAETGEVRIRAQHLSAGWIGADGFHPWDADGFHPTGDVGRIDETGRLLLLGRLADMLKTGGYKLFPAEIERAIGAELVVVGLPSTYWGEIIVAVAERPAPDWEARARAGAETLAPFKRPRFYLPLDALPRNAQGKVVRRAIVAALLERYRLEDGPRPRLLPR